MRNKKIFIGILFIVAGVGLVANRLGYFPGVNVFSLLTTAYLGYMIIKNIGKRNIFGILIPLALIGVIYWDFTGISNFNPWTLVWAAILISIGISIIFRPKRKYKMDWKFDDETRNIYGEEDGKIYIESTFSECIRYLQGEDIERVRLENTFGSMKIYFDNLKAKDNHLLVDIKATFSGLELYIPKDWEVIPSVETSFAGIDEKNKGTGEKTTRVILQGGATFAGIEIIYV